MTTPNELSYRLRRDRRKVMREQIDGEAAIRELVTIEERLKGAGADLSSNELGGLKLRAEIQRIRLGKVLPDLKSVEHDIGDGLADIADSELETRIAELIGKAGALLASEGKEPAE